MSALFDKAKSVDDAAGKKVAELNAVIAAKDAEINSLKAQLAEVPAVADVLDQALAKLA